MQHWAGFMPAQFFCGASLAANPDLRGDEVVTAWPGPAGKPS
jgi:hypothetical protein